jgi:hypothetical protein
VALFERLTEWFTCSGLFVSASPSNLPPGKFPFLFNVRAYLEQALVSRLGLTAVNTTPLSQTNIHSLTRLNDSSSFATTPTVRVTGAGNGLYIGVPAANPPSEVDSGYSANPLTFAIATPPQSPRPYVYVGDSARTGKSTTDGPVYAWGIAPPVNAPTIAVQPLLTIVIDDFVSVGGWALANSAIAGSPTTNAPITTSIATILFDSGSTGWALINPTSMANLSIGERIKLSGTETVVVTDVKIPVADTIIGAIRYDAGTKGLCSIVPTGSLGTGQIGSSLAADLGTTEAGSPFVATAVPRASPTTINPEINLPPEPSTQSTVTPTQPINFPVDSLITIGGEAVRILSVQVGRNGTLAFRCSTAFNHAAGVAIVGLPALRVYCALTHANGDALTMDSLTQTLTPVNAAPFVAGIQNTSTWAGGTLNLAQFGANGTAVLPDDYIHLSLNVNFLTTVTEVRIYFDVNGGSNPFLANYYMAVWSAADLAVALQTINAGAVTPIAQVAAALAASAATSANVAAGNQVAPLTPTQLAQELSLGNDQWIELTMPVGSLIRVGADTSKTLGTVNAVEILVSANGVNTLTVQYASLWLSGGGNVDISTTGTPIFYWYRYRSTSTGAVSNPSPMSLGGVIPRRQALTMFSTHSGDAQVTVEDWFRQGANLATPTYVGSWPVGSAVAMVDNFSDSELDGGEPLSFTCYQPWPTLGGPVTGTVNVVGSSVSLASGGPFNVNWAPGMQILINGLPYTLYAQPASTSFLTLVENGLNQTGAAFYIPNPTLMGQPLQSIFAGTVTGVLYIMAVGDPNNPGTVYWTNPNASEMTTDANTVQVTDASEPLLAGWWYDGIPYVLSTEQIYALQPDYGAASPATPFHPQITPCGRGGWTPWAWALGEGGVAFLSKDGMYFSAGSGALAQSLTNPDLRLLFPHDGGPGIAITTIAATIYPPDLTQTTQLRLSYVAGYFYFDFQDTNGAQSTLAFEWAAKRWWYDQYGVRVQVRDWEPGESVNAAVIGTSTGYLATMGGLTDLGVAIAGTFLTHSADVGDPRVYKQWGDFAVNTLAPAAAGVTATPWFGDDDGPLPAIALANTQQAAIPCDLNAGDGQSARTMSILVNWVTTVAGLIFYWWQPSYVPKVENIIDRGTDWSNLGSPGAKWVQGIIIRANTYGVHKTLQIQGDGGVVYLTLVINHPIEQSIAYPNAAAGWTPFTAHLVRLVGADAVQWQLFDAETVWVSEPAPESATSWVAQETTLDYPGWFSIRDFMIAHVSTADLTLTLNYDGVPSISYDVPNSGGQYARTYIPALAALKGRSVQPVITSSQPFQLFKRDCAMRAQGWGDRSGYRVFQPFGGNSRVDGAAI